MPQLLAVLNEENYTYILVYVYSLGMFLLVNIVIFKRNTLAFKSMH